MIQKLIEEKNVVVGCEVMVALKTECSVKVFEAKVVEMNDTMGVLIQPTCWEDWMKRIHQPQWEAEKCLWIHPNYIRGVI